MKENMASAGARLRAAHNTCKPLISPVAHDALSARLIELAGFKSFDVGGNALLTARYALPDLGIAALSEMADGIRDIVNATKLPALVDADDGYGDVKGVARTVETYETMGVAGILLEDQIRESKQPGAATARGVAPLDLFENKLRAAMDARTDRDFVIIGRTDAFGAVGLDEALRRGERFLKLGVDGVFLGGLKTIKDYEAVGSAFRGQWNSATVFQALGTPWLSPSEVYGMGFSQVAYPNLLIGRVAKTIELALSRLTDFSKNNNAAFDDSDHELALDRLKDVSQLAKWAAIETKYS
jgi:2-methylisocitrate lyase-like PEP mutase family enzyme